MISWLASVVFVPIVFAATDFRGRAIPTTTAPKRVVALIPSLAETIIEMGRGESLVGAPEYSRLPENLKSKVASIGSYNQISAETVARLKPDLVLANIDGNDSALVRQLERLGLNIVTLDTSSIASILKSFELTAEALQTPFTKKFKELDGLFKANTLAAKQPPTVFLQVGWDPIVTISKHTYIHEILARAGGTNIFAQAKMKYPRPNPEEVVAQNPDVIVICKLTDDGIEAQKAVAFWRQFTKLKAVQTNKIYVIEGDILTKPTLRLVEGLRELKRAL